MASIFRTDTAPRRVLAPLAALVFLLNSLPAYSFGYTREPQRYLEESTSSNRIATGDFDGDGGADVAFCYGGQRVLVYSQHANGALQLTFDGAVVAANQPPPGLPWAYSVYSCRISAADLNADGLDDLVVTHSQGLLQLLARGDRGFDRAERGFIANGGVRSHGVVDVDGNGIADILLHQYGANVLNYVPRDANGNLGPVTAFKTLASTHHNSDLAVGDLNSDGLPDIAFVGSRVADFTAERISSLEVFMQQGAGSFQALPVKMFPAGSAIEHARVGDVNGDGLKDLVATANVGSAVLVFEQQADGSLLDFLAYGAYAAPKSFALEDMDGDGLIDLVVNNVGEYLGLPGATGLPGLSTYLQRSSILAFDHQVTNLDNNGNEEPDAIAVGDFNSDGCKDVLVAASGAYHRLNSNGCIAPARADTAVTLDTLDWRTIVTVHNKSGSAVAAGGTLRVHLVSHSGTIGLQYVPPECVLSAPVARTAVLECPVTALAPGASSSFQFNYPRKLAIDRSLRVYAAMDGLQPDPTVSDNRSESAVARRLRATSTPLPIHSLTKPPARRAGRRDHRPADTRRSSFR